MSEDLFSKALENPDQNLDLKLNDDVKIDSEVRDTNKSETNDKVPEIKDTEKVEKDDKDEMAEKDTQDEMEKKKEDQPPVSVAQPCNEKIDMSDELTTVSSKKKGVDSPTETDGNTNGHKTEQSNESEINSDDSISNKIDTKDITSEVSETGFTSYVSEDSDEPETSSDSSSDDNEISNMEDHDSDMEEPSNTEPIRSKNEMLQDITADLPEDYKIDEKATIMPIGKIKSLIDDNFIITADISGEKRVLEEGSIFCLEDKTPLGVLREVFGPLQSPYYRVGITSKLKGKKEPKDYLELSVFIVLKDVHWIDTFELKKIKGSDASNMFDEELPEEEQEFSDDEKEAMYKKHKKQKKRGGNERNNNQNFKRPKNETSVSVAQMKVPVGMTKSSGYTSRSSREGKSKTPAGRSDAQNVTQRTPTTDRKIDNIPEQHSNGRQPQPSVTKQTNQHYFGSVQQNMQNIAESPHVVQHHITYPNIPNSQFMPNQFQPPNPAMFQFAPQFQMAAMSPVRGGPPTSMSPPPPYGNVNMYSSPQPQFIPMNHPQMPIMPGTQPNIGQQAYQLHQILMQQQQQQQQQQSPHMPHHQMLPQHLAPQHMPPQNIQQPQIPPQHMQQSRIPPFHYGDNRPPSNQTNGH
ncbi:H/ACA ribonucleoprotein complex non-core subunit NAF1 [Nakaseomyces bracarensis]|uniref:H/ACA ribonucleoprotein complex non-core subunit NAF1 n=1 Tax=Nakaseomyces bracarensis TaxID=273131 RepID=A0ABR4NV43_9SACH